LVLSFGPDVRRASGHCLSPPPPPPSPPPIIINIAIAIAAWWGHAKGRDRSSERLRRLPPSPQLLAFPPVACRLAVSRRRGIELFFSFSVGFTTLAWPRWCCPQVRLSSQGRPSEKKCRPCSRGAPSLSSASSPDWPAVRKGAAPLQPSVQARLRRMNGEVHLIATCPKGQSSRERLLP
jgi:hypothetical protein